MLIKYEKNKMIITHDSGVIAECTKEQLQNFQNNLDKRTARLDQFEAAIILNIKQIDAATDNI
jgi:hypothetical protein